jgi:hypothetical protein
MKISTIVFCLVMGIPVFAAKPAEEFKTRAGTLKITPIMHAALAIEAGGQEIVVDPAMGDYSALPKADVILITDIHGDHLAPEQIAKLRKRAPRSLFPARPRRTFRTGSL